MVISVRSQSTPPGTDQAGNLRNEVDVALLRNPALSLGVVMGVTGYLRSFLWSDAAEAAPAAGAAAPAAPATAQTLPRAAMAAATPEAGALTGLEESGRGSNAVRGGGSPQSGIDAEAPARMAVALPPDTELPVPAGDAAPGIATPAGPEALIRPAGGPGALAEPPAAEAAPSEATAADDAEAPAEAAADATPAAGAVAGAGARLLGTPGDDRIAATELADEIMALAGNDLIHAMGGDDRIDAGEGNDIVLAGPGNDVVLAGAGNDQVDAGPGDDRVWGGDGQDQLLGGEGDDLLDGGDGDDLLHGGPGNDELVGGAGNDAIAGGTGRDLIFGGLGDDLLDGEEDDDTLFGGAGRDILMGGAGNDLLDGGAGADQLFGGAGDDWLIAAADGADDVYLGGDGVDILDFSGQTEALVIDLAAGSAVSLANGHDSFAQIEVVIAGAGDDMIAFGASPVTVTGGAGADCFDFSRLEPSAPAPLVTRHAITDFEVGDRLRFGGSDFFRASAKDGDCDATPDGPGTVQVHAFGRLAEESFDNGGVRLTFVNRAEADRLETLVLLDLDRDGTPDFAIDIAHAGAWAFADQDPTAA